MQWNSLSDFWAMGGYGLYVWSSFGLCAIAMVIEPLWLRARHRQVKNRLNRSL